MRRFQSPPKHGKRYTYRPGAYAILAQGRDLLLTRQLTPKPEFQLPGGGIDPGESPLAALHREVMEETGWSLSRAVRLGAYRRFTFMPDYDLWAEKICHIYLARPARRIGPPTENDHMAVWTPVDFAIDLLASDGDAEFVRQIFN